MKKAQQIKFLERLDFAFNFHINNVDNPHGSSIATAVAIIEIRNAFAIAAKLPVRDLNKEAEKQQKE